MIWAPVLKVEICVLETWLTDFGKNLVNSESLLVDGFYVLGYGWCVTVIEMNEECTKKDCFQSAWIYIS